MQTTTVSQKSVTVIRISLGIVFLWFGLLKVMGLSPVEEMVTGVYSFVPQPLMFLSVGIFEVIIGLGFLLNKWLKYTVILFWLQMIGVFLSLVIAPAVFFTNGNPLLITMEGEFVVKNIVFIAASLVLWDSTKRLK